MMPVDTSKVGWAKPSIETAVPATARIASSPAWSTTYVAIGTTSSWWTSVAPEPATAASSASSAARRPPGAEHRPEPARAALRAGSRTSVVTLMRAVPLAAISSSIASMSLSLVETRWVNCETDDRSPAGDAACPGTSWASGGFVPTSPRSSSFGVLSSAATEAAAAGGSCPTYSVDSPSDCCHGGTGGSSWAGASPRANVTLPADANTARTTPDPRTKRDPERERYFLPTGVPFPLSRGSGTHGVGPRLPRARLFSKRRICATDFGHFGGYDAPPRPGPEPPLGPKPNSESPAVWRAPPTSDRFGGAAGQG